MAQPEYNEPEYDAERTSTFSASERIMCSFLIESLNATPLKSIIYISRAVMMLTESDIEQYKIDAKEVISLFSVSERLVFASEQNQGSSMKTYKIDFSSLDYDTQIDTWTKMNAYDYCIPKDNVGTETNDMIIEELGPFEKMVYSTKNLTDTGYQHMVSDFLMYAIPITQKWAYLLTTKISPSTYTEMLKVYKGSRDD